MVRFLHRGESGEMHAGGAGPADALAAVRPSGRGRGEVRGKKRPTAKEAMAHPFFDEVRNLVSSNTRMKFGDWTKV